MIIPSLILIKIHQILLLQSQKNFRAKLINYSTVDNYDNDIKTSFAYYIQHCLDHIQNTSNHEYEKEKEKEKEKKEEKEKEKKKEKEEEKEKEGEEEEEEEEKEEENHQLIKNQKNVP